MKTNMPVVTPVQAWNLFFEFFSILYNLDPGAYILDSGKTMLT